MKVLLLAPEPFYQERGTPIAVDLLVKALSERGDQVDLLVYNEGEERHYESVEIHRIRPHPAVTEVRPGFSFKKIYLDIWFFCKFVYLMCTRRYDVVHAVEESAFMAMCICPLFRVPFIYDMDSLMTAQLVDRYAWLRPFEKILRGIESLPMRFAKAVIPVCDALRDEVKHCPDSGVFILKDVTLVDHSKKADAGLDVRDRYGISGPILMYIGNLEFYQGIGLLLNGFAEARQMGGDTELVIIGGDAPQIETYAAVARSLGIAQWVHFLGKQPVVQIDAFMRQADMLISPRTHGVNTPMKIYSYLDSGVSVIATNLPTHTQVITGDIACLVEPSADAIAAAIIRLAACPDERGRLARNARAYIQREHSYEVFREQLFAIYHYLEFG